MGTASGDRVSKQAMADQEGEPRGGQPSVASLPGVEGVPGAPGIEDPNIVGAEPPLVSGGTVYPVQSTMGQPQSVQIQTEVVP